MIEEVLQQQRREASVTGNSITNFLHQVMPSKHEENMLYNSWPFQTIYVSGFGSIPPENRGKFLKEVFYNHDNILFPSL